MQFAPPNAVAVFGLVLLANKKEVLDLGTIAHAKLRENGVLDLKIHGQAAMMVLTGEDAEGVWNFLQTAARPTAELLAPPEPEPIPAGVVPAESFTGTDVTGVDPDPTATIVPQPEGSMTTSAGSPLTVAPKVAPEGQVETPADQAPTINAAPGEVATVGGTSATP